MKPNRMCTALLALLAIAAMGASQRTYALSIAPGTERLEINLALVLGIPYAGTTIGPSGAHTVMVWSSPFNLPGPGDPPVIVPIELRQLNLHSINPVDFGGSFFDVFIELDPIVPSTGHIEVGPGGTFSSFFDVFFDIRLDPILPGPVQELIVPPIQFTGGGEWFIDPFNGFHIQTLDLQSIGDIDIQIRQSRIVPEPATIVLVGLGIAGLTAKARRRLGNSK
jgi:hypothetical protein